MVRSSSLTKPVSNTVLAALVALAIGACSKGHGCGEAPASSDADATTLGSHVRSPDVVRRDGNGLVGNASEYLREHAHDPVDWQPWSDAAFARAAAENKPIFLSIGYSACHFCHVMHDEVFAKDDVAEILDAHFVCIKVDREERPDIDATYIAALERMTGSAGWPATLFLTPARDAFFGATYVPHDRFLDLAKKASDAWARRDAGAFSVVALKDLLDEAAPPKGTALDADELLEMARDATSHMDPLRGGMKGNAKFPMVPRLSFLLHAVRKWDLPELTAALRATLDAMMNGALRDPVSGGFHRYTTDPDWETPHFEIMLYDDAELASLYLEAAAVLEEPRYADIARDTLDFIAREMRVASGAFAASFDADTRGEEGAAWRWSKSEIEAVAGADGAKIATLLGVADAKTAPRLHLPIADSDLAKAWERARPLMRAARAGVAQRDDKVVAAWNGLAIEAFSKGFLATGDARYRDVAIAAGDAVWKELHEAKGSLTRTPGGADAFAIDDADLAAAFLSVFEATSDPRWLARADALLHEASVLEATDGGFFDGKSDLARQVSLEDGPEPSATAAMLHALLLRNALAPADTWHSPVARALTRYGNALRADPLAAAGWLDAALLGVGPMYEVVVAGAPSDAAVLAAVDAQLAPSWRIFLSVPREGADASLLAAVPSLAGKSATVGHARAFVCANASCKSPAPDPVTFRKQLLEGWRR